MLKVQITPVSTLDESKIPVNVSKTLYGEIELKVKHSKGAFQSVEDYIEFVLEEFVKQDEKDEDDKVKAPENEEVKEKLRRLGYM
jgi:hypothetical protein